jgi:hypothetical protein
MNPHPGQPGLNSGIRVITPHISIEIFAREPGGAPASYVESVLAIQGHFHAPAGRSGSSVNFIVYLSHPFQDVPRGAP